MKKRSRFQIISLLIVFSFTLTACLPTSRNLKVIDKQTIDPNILVDAPFSGWVSGLPKIQAPKGFDWHQFAGTKLKLISETTPPSSALKANMQDFEKVTGIQVSIEQNDLEAVVNQTGLDFNAHSGADQMIYADPYQILAEYSNQFVDLNTFNEDPDLPHIPGGLKDFISTQLAVDGYMGDKTKLYTLPYDCPTMIMAYRKDIFAKYKNLFLKEEGFDWTPGPKMTWEQYYTIARWIDEKIKAGVITEAKYGTGLQAKQYDSLMCDFSNILAAYGGDYFENKDLGYYGTNNPKPGPSTLTTQKAIDAARFYKKLFDVSDPESTSWDWLDLAQAFANGDLAMAPMWHEYSAMFENPSVSKIVGQVGWTTLPTGPVRSANNFGGTGIGINKYATIKEQKAAWLFLVWATSPQIEYMILKSKQGGETPTRYSVYQLPVVQKGMQPGTEEAKKMPNLIPMNATLEAWKKNNIYTRPKIPRWTEFDTIIFTELSKMLQGTQRPDATMQTIARKIDTLTGQD